MYIEFVNPTYILRIHVIEIQPYSTVVLVVIVIENPRAHRVPSRTRVFIFVVTNSFLK